MIHGSILLKRIHQPIKISRLLIHDLKRKIEQNNTSSFFIINALMAKETYSYTIHCACPTTLY